MSTPDPADVITEGQREFTEMAPSMLKQKVVALVFLPWLTRYTGRLVEVAKEEERRAILAELARQKKPTGKREWRAGYEAAIEQARELIQSRSATAISDLIGSVDGLPADLSARTKQYLRGGGHKPPR